MNNEMQVFQYCQTTEVRMTWQDNEPWWVLADVCQALGIQNSRDVVKRLDDDEKGIDQIYTLGGPQQMTIINESGLYSVILRSDKPQAKAFKRWVTHEVLPAIRKTGSYSTGVQPNQIPASFGLTAPCLKKSAQLLWYTLLQLEVGGEVRISNQKLAQLMNIRSESTLRTARKELVEAGYIAFYSGVKGKPSIYQLKPHSDQA